MGVGHRIAAETDGLQQTTQYRTVPIAYSRTLTSGRNIIVLPVACG
jgi:hypothetical protein